MKTPLISVIIPTHNSESTIQNCIESLISTSFSRDKFEIIIVDDGSTDETVNIAKRIGVDKIIETHQCFPGIARNIGVRDARGEFLAFLDSDCKIKVGWFESIIDELQKIQAMSGPIENGNTHSLVAWAEYFVEFGGFDRNRKQTSLRFLPGCNQAIQKETFEKAGGFSNVRASEDVIFGESLKKINVKPVFIKNFQILHLCRTKLSNVVSNTRLLGRYTVVARRTFPALRYSSVVISRWGIPLIFFSKILKSCKYAISAKKTIKFILSFPIILIIVGSFCKGAWMELSDGSHKN